MEEQNVQKEEVEVEMEEKEIEPIYYKPKTLNLVAILAGIFSWVVLLGFVGVLVGRFMLIKDSLSTMPFAQLMANQQFQDWAYTNWVLPLVEGLAFFFILQGVAIGLNVLMEIDFNLREG